MTRWTGLLAIALLAWAPLALSQTTLRVANWLPPSHLLVSDVLKPWGEAVEKATGGSVQVEVMSSPLGPPPAQYDLVADGLADVGFSVHGYTPGRFSVFELAELPLQTPSAEVKSVAYWRAYQETMADSGEHRGVHLLGLFTHGPGHIWNSRRPVHSLDDLSGLKLRVPGGVAAQLSEELGVVPVNAPSSQSYELLSQGVADGIVFPYESVTFFNLQDTVDYGTVVPGGLYTVSFYVVMNQAKWQSLSDDERAAIDSVSGEYLARLAGRAWDRADRQGRKDLRAAGVRIEQADDAMIEAIAEQADGLRERVLERVAEDGVDGQAFLDALHRELEAAGAE
ncbi:Outer membrane transporter protein TsaT [wastewater metagenome]|uniref:Outer membrane transporter protein TsaT n=2 Tax=unclassified sequences TaxID=12908 RepID=A0A5B8RIF7_9ZZZZ|nr:MULTISPECIES: TRAP transporter substrate-binding protein [Arhodomonas]QEA06795.1 outer membrane transporter protein TsaT [uncultured organism]